MLRTWILTLSLLTVACAPPLQEVQVQAPTGAAAARAAQTALKSILPAADDSVKFGVIGDSGTGDRRQYEVATVLARTHARFPFEFVIMLGDNLYGSEGPSAYVSKFERPYKPLLDAGVDFYAALGNHDEPAQRFYEPFNMGGQRYYTHTQGNIEFFVLDSTYMTPAQLQWLQTSLERSNADWKVAYMHHPMYSSGEKHGSETALQELVEPLFLAHGVDVVFAGHEHFYERLRPQKGIHYITQGGSAKLRRGNIRSSSPMTAEGFDTDRSFTLVEVVDDQMFVETISRSGTIVDQATILRREAAVTTTN